MAKIDPLSDTAPQFLHAKIDRAWLIREDEGAVNITTSVRDPENPHVHYSVSISVMREYR